MALSANAEIQEKDGILLSIPVEDNVHIYKGALVCINAAGYAIPGANTAGLVLAGVAYEEMDNTLTGHAQGGKSVRVVRAGLFQFVAASLQQTRVGEMAYIADDTTFGYYGQATVTAYVPAGRIVYFNSATSGWIDIGAALHASYQNS